MKIQVPSRQTSRHAFTLVEVMVSSVLVVLLMALLLQTVSQSQNLMSRTTARVNQFKAARSAFESMTRRLSQATLNTYYRAFDQNPLLDRATYSYARESELQFISSPTATTDAAKPGIFTSPDIPNLEQPANLCYPTHSMFFQAPLGITWERDTSVADAYLPEFRALDEALVGLGYFIEFGPDPSMPSFLRKLDFPNRERFRLIELNVPTERLTIFQRPLDTGNKRFEREPQILDAKKASYVGMTDLARRLVPNWVRPYWLDYALEREPIPGTDAEGYRFKYGQVMAENVIALVIVPKVARKDRFRLDYINDLVRDYRYDSWRILDVDPAKPFEAARDNQLPPIVQVTMVVIDEPSAARAAERYKGDPPPWTDGLFEGRVSSEARLLEDIDRLEQRLLKEPTPISYRIFTKDIVIRASKFSKDPFEAPPEEEL